MNTIAHPPEDDVSVPTFAAAVDSPLSWLREMAGPIRDRMLAHGAVLIHDLPVDGPDALAAARSALGIADFTPVEVFNRRSDFGNGVLSPISWPLDRHICPIQESSFSRTFPSVVLTACVRPPDDGLARLVDARRMGSHLPARLADRVRADGWTMARNFHAGFGLSWQQAFSVAHRAGLEALLEAEGIDSDWLPNGSLHTLRHLPGFVDHPVTGEACWFNQLAFLNAGSLEPAERAFMARAFGEHLPMNTFFGDGSPLSEEDVEAVDHAYDELRIDVPWRRGDLLITDNVLMAQGRSVFDGSPEFLVALGRHP